MPQLPHFLSDCDKIQYKRRPQKGISLYVCIMKQYDIWK